MCTQACPTLPAAAPLIDPKTEAFVERLVGIMTGGALNLMLSIGHRTGLFDTMAKLPPSTSSTIAERAALNERYVREWLGAMVTGKIIDFEPATKTYALPEEYAAVLTRGNFPNLAGTMQWLAVLGGVEDKIVDCFKNGGGVPYEAFDRFHEVMAEESGQTVVAALNEYILPIVPGLVERLAAGIEVADIGCGSGRALIRMAREFPHSRFVGLDLCADAIAAARREAERHGLSNIRFEVHDVSNLAFRDHFDLITGFDVIHDQAKPAVVLAQVAKALKPGGIFLMQDILASSDLEKNIDNPLATFLYSISTMHCMTVSLAQGGAGLGTCWGRELAEAMLRDAGFQNVSVQTLPHDEMNYYYVSYKVAK